MNPNVRRISHQRKISDFQRQDYVPNNFPTTTYSPKERYIFSIEEEGQGTSQGILEKCIICKGSQSPEGRIELFSCDGQISGEMENGEVIPLKKRPIRHCNSLFHLDCIKEYNSNGFDFSYAARIECQRKFLCPLHCCSVCNQEHKKQSAYESTLIECAHCYRAFHADCCYPAGSEELVVTMGPGKIQFKMLVCPYHSDPAPVAQHIPACCAPNCDVDMELQECKKCIRSFHQECREVKRLDRKDAPEDTCDSCLRKDVILVGSPVIDFCMETKKFEMGKALAADPDLDMPVIALNPATNTFKMGRAGAADRQGWIRIKWPKHGRPDGQMSLVPSSHVAEVRESYLHLAERNQKSFWETTFDDYKDTHLQRYPPVFKKVFKTVKVSRYAKGNQSTMSEEETEDYCECGEYANCEEGSCHNVDQDQECPPSCSEKKKGKFVCKNQKIYSGYIHPDIERRKAGKKGYGIFAKARIEKGEFLAGFHGEICDEEEYQRRNAVKKDSKDSQYIYQFMDLRNGFTMDMTTHGNISRYVNNSCKNFNAKAQLKLMYVRECGETLYYEDRCYLEATKTIEKDAEVTISYGFSDKNTTCFCDTCKEETEEPEWHDDRDQENAKSSGAKKRKTTSKNNSSSAKAFKSLQ